MAAGAGYYDANGVYKYGETDNIGLVSDLLNIGMDSVSNSITNLTSGILTAWTAYTPTYLNFTPGNGSTYARYKKIGKTVIVQWDFTTGSTTTFAGTPVVSLPFAMLRTEYNMAVASITNGSGIYPLIANGAGTANAVELYGMNAAGTWTIYAGFVGGISTAAGARISFMATYETAA